MVDRINSDILYQRLLEFAKKSQRLVSKPPKTVYNIEYGSQLIRSSGSPGSNYIEVMEASSRKEFTYKLKVCRRETKESTHWLFLIQHANSQIAGIYSGAEELIREGRELIRIFTSSVLTSEKNQGIRK